MTAETTLEILRLGGAGDGVARGEQGETLHVEGALPGETVRVALPAGAPPDLIEILERSPDRTVPPCPHAEECGGCALQHWAPAAQAVWKRQRIIDALARHGLETEVAATAVSPLRSRRRLRFAARRSRKSTLLGFHARRSHRVIDIADCLIARPAILRAAPALRALARLAAPRDRTIGIWVLHSESGLDIALEDAKPLDLDLRQASAIWAEDSRETADVARLTWNGEPVFERHSPTVRFGRAPVSPPPGGFLQATAEGEATLAGFAAEALKGAKRVADLFCGAGAFALRLAETADVLALDGDAPAIAALDAGWRRADGLRRVHSTKRDLFRRPLLAREMAGLDGALFDPPRAGAAAQAAELAAAPFERLVGVSCNPATFARDAETLVGGGWRLRRVLPVDQFLFSPHVELAALFER